MSETTPADPQKTVIFRSENILVILQDFPGEEVFITFNELGMTVQYDRYWADNLFARLGWPSIGIVTTEPNWYPPLQMMEAVRVIKSAVGTRRVFTYGHSQGGYGALKFSGALGATTAIAFCPQTSIDPTAVGYFDQRFCKYFNGKLSGGLPIEGSDLCPDNYIFFDPLERRDYIYAGALRALGSRKRRIHTIPVPFTGHETIRLVTQGGISEQFVSSFRNERTPATTALGAMLRRVRGQAGIYRVSRTQHLIRKSARHPRLVERELAALEPSVRPLVCLLSLVGQGRLTEAASAMSAMSDSDFRGIDIPFIVEHCRKYQFLDGPRRIADVIPRIYPESAAARVQAVVLYCQLKLNDLAEREWLEVLVLDGAPQLLGVMVACAKMLRAPHLLELLLTNSRYDAALSDPAIRQSIVLDKIFLHWVRNEGEAALRHIESLEQTVLLDRRHIEKVTGAHAAGAALDYAFSLFDRYPQFKRDEHAFSQVELLELLARRDKKRAADRFLKMDLDFGDQPNDWQYASKIAELLDDKSKALELQRRARLLRLELAVGNEKLARRQLLRLYASRHGDAAALQAGIETCIQLKRFDCATGICKKMLALSPNNVESRMLLARCTLLQGHRAKSRRIAAAIWADKSTLIALPEPLWPQLATYLHNPQDNRLATAVLRAGLFKFPHNPELRKLSVTLAGGEPAQA